MKSALSVKSEFADASEEDQQHICTVLFLMVSLFWNTAVKDFKIKKVVLLQIKIELGNLDFSYFLFYFFPRAIKYKY